MKYIIVQAGGKGTRMKYLTKNKPKCLVSIENKPMIFHLFDKFPKAKFIVIGDYKYDVLEKFLEAFAKVDYTLVNAHGFEKTCGGVSQALESIPEDIPFLYIWSDLILSNEIKLPTEIQSNFIGLSRDFRCRWRYENVMLLEEPSSSAGVAGFFIFKNKKEISRVPQDGSFVTWLSSTNIEFEEFSLKGAREFGLLEEFEKLPTQFCRPFNKVTLQNERIIKEGIDSQGKSLAQIEEDWYKKAQDLHVQNIPKIHSFSPLIMEKISGNHPYLISDTKRQNKVLVNIIESLKKIHALEKIPSSIGCLHENYIYKTYERLKKIEKLLPFACQKEILINGVSCKNPLFSKEVLHTKLEKYYPSEFSFILGDCTFSNMLIDDSNAPFFIDPRGYFGKTKYHGDEAYDWAKLYYSLVGNYDQFNLKRFELDIQENCINYKIKSNQWEWLESVFFENIPQYIDKEYIKLIHGIIWLSLTTYAWDNYDSIACAFYHGTFLLNEYL